LFFVLESYPESYETPSISWTDKTLRGHLVATRRYAPEDHSETAVQVLWDAGEGLKSKDPSDRTIYYPKMTFAAVTEKEIGKGDGTTVLFSGTLVPLHIYRQYL
jgi:hypothetical protein